MAIAISPASHVCAVTLQSDMSPVGVVWIAYETSGDVCMKKIQITTGKSRGGNICDELFLAGTAMTDHERPTISWHPNDKDRVKAMFMAGMTRQAIADEFPGRTRNAICGLLNRMELSDKSRGRIRQRRHPMDSNPRKRLEAGQGNPRVRPRKTFADVLEAVSKSPVSHEPLRVLAKPAGLKPLLDLRNGECRWPSGEGTIAEPFAFCAAQQADGSSYCEVHHEEAHRSYASEYRRTA